MSRELLAAIQREEEVRGRQSPCARFAYRTVTFATANTPVDISNPWPNAALATIGYVTVSSSAAATLYTPATPLWNPQTLWLCADAPTTMRILFLVERS